MNLFFLEGGQFEPVKGGQFEPVYPVQLKSVSGGQHNRFLHIQSQSGKIIVGQGTFQRFVVFFYCMHGCVYKQGNVVLLRFFDEITPAAGFFQKKHIAHILEVCQLYIFFFAFG